VYCNPVGCDPITAIQGRYFIAIAPLFFLLLGNRAVPAFLGRLGSREERKGNMKKGRGKKSPVQVTAISWDGHPGAPLWAMTGALVLLLCSVYVILERFYVILLSSF
ncbi:MAG TPA: hypothetical protein PKG48_11960, partial [Bacteroidales bacterium]|nr:hypothetical protein [Bacteroidales bacterium]